MPLSEALNQLFRDAFTSPAGAAGFTAMAGVNLFEKDDSYILQIPLPGVKPDQLNITVRENVVTLRPVQPGPDPNRWKWAWPGSSQRNARVLVRHRGASVVQL